MHNQPIVSDRCTAVIGVGVTGCSVVRYLLKQGRRIEVFDTRKEGRQLQAFKSEFPDLPLHCGTESLDALEGMSEIILSPGLDPQSDWLQTPRSMGIPVVGDVELFARVNRAPVIAITGSNGKSTVTTLVGLMAEACGLKVSVGGNLGRPALDLLDDDPELVVLELSSFQLQLVDSLQADAATILNLSPDHQDRHPTMLDYHSAKQRIYRQAKTVVANADDELTAPLLQQNQKLLRFGLGKPDLQDFGCQSIDDDLYLVRGSEALLQPSELALRGEHNVANVLAALALGQSINLPMSTMITVARSFEGLDHRCQRVAWAGDIEWIDDSKATNLGAAQAALISIGKQKAFGVGQETEPGSAHKKIIWIAGGQAKGQSFVNLKETVNHFVRAAVLIGEDATLLHSQAASDIDVVYAVDMESAVSAAQMFAEPGDVVLLSPACASFDMFDSYIQRGKAFKQAVGNLTLPPGEVQA